MTPLTLEEISDRIEIDDLLTRYATAVDTQDWDLYTTCFTEDAFIDYTAAGGVKGNFPDVRDWLEKTMAMFPMTQHLVANRAVEVKGDTATARSMFYNPMSLPEGEDSQKVWIEGGYYNDKLVRTGAGWRICERIEDSSYSTMRHKMILAG
jgi:3-phenylpropionate/cinnamic acid dioxygenase small subunit